MRAYRQQLRTMIKRLNHRLKTAPPRDYVWYEAQRESVRVLLRYLPRE